MQTKINDQRMMKKKKNKLRQQNDRISPQSEEKSLTTNVLLSNDAVKLKSLHIFEPWIKRDELDVRKLFQLND